MNVFSLVLTELVFSCGAGLCSRQKLMDEEMLWGDQSGEGQSTEIVFYQSIRYESKLTHAGSSFFTQKPFYSSTLLMVLLSFILV